MGIYALLLACASAFATKNTYRATYWYITGDVCTTTTANKICAQTGTGCVGTQPESLGS